MLGAMGHSVDYVFVRTAVALTCGSVGYLVWRYLWKQREERREYRERGRQRRQF